MNWNHDQYNQARDGPKQGGTLRVSAAEGRLLLQQQAQRGTSGRTTPDVPATGPKPSKLGNTRTEYNGIWYDSKAEANRARTLDLLIKAGEVLHWERQVVFDLTVASVHICKYKLDFRVHWADGRTTFEDVKGQRSGVPYDLFKAKKRLMLACHGITVDEIK